jgi:hypothetical protein
MSVFIKKGYKPIRKSPDDKREFQLKERFDLRLPVDYRMGKRAVPSEVSETLYQSPPRDWC